MSGPILIGDVAHKIRMLEIACSRCPRKGRLSMARLLHEHGPTLPIYKVWEDLNHDCPNRGNVSLYVRCHVHAPNLKGLT